MLGKGLESLIPPKANQSAGTGDAANNPANNNTQPIFLPVGDILGNPAEELPSGSEEKELPPPAVASQIAPAVSSVPVNAASSDGSAPKVASTPFAPFSAEDAAKLKKKEDKEQQSIFHIEVEKIVPNPGQPRRHFDEKALRELANSIREFGFLQPIVVTKKERETPGGVDVSYELIAGERRLTAAKLLGLRTVPAIIRNVSLAREKLELAVIENIQRENLNPVETARAFQRLQEEFRMTQREIAAKLGKSRETVANSVRLLDLPAYIQEALEKNELSESHGRLLLGINDPAAQKNLFDDILQKKLTTRDVKDRVQQITKKPHAAGADANLTPEIKDMQEHLSATLGAPVEIRHGAANGKITITFYSEEELGNILRRLGTEGSK